MSYADLTAPFQGVNDEINDLEVGICDEQDVYMDLTINTQDPVPDGDEWNTEM